MKKPYGNTLWARAFIALVRLLSIVALVVCGVLVVQALSWLLAGMLT